MKNYFILTSVLALAACGGGSGGGGVSAGGSGVFRAPTNGIGAAFVIQENPVVDDNNTALTGMASYTVSSGVNQNDLINYVSNNLGSDVFSQENYDSIARSAVVARSATPLGSSESDIAKKKAIALAKISEMKTVLYEMVTADDPEAYVGENREAVRMALVLFDKLDKDDDIGSMSDAELLALFNDGGDPITKDTIMSKFDDFDTANFGFSKETLSNVLFQSAGEDAIFQFKMDDTGKITHIALVENPVGEYNAVGDDNQKYFYSLENGYFTRIARTEADEAYRPSKEGWFTRDGVTKNFNNTYYEYSISLGEHTLGEGYWQDSQLQTLKVYSNNGELTGDALKQAAIDALLARGDKTFTTQADAESKTKWGEIVKFYADKIRAGTFAEPTPTEINAVATMDSIGKDHGLKYSDFGYGTLTETVGLESETMYSPYAGGYETRRMDQATPNEDLNGATFSGAVIAAVEHTKVDHGAKTKHDMLVSGNGVLTYAVDGAKAVHTLVATDLQNTENPNLYWYNFTMTGTPGESLSFKFDQDGKTVPNEYQFFIANEEDGDMYVSKNDGLNAATWVIKTNGADDTEFSYGDSVPDGYRVNLGADPQYYGADPDNPSEATVRFNFSEEWHNGTNSNRNEVAIYGAFGGTRD